MKKNELAEIKKMDPKALLTKVKTSQGELLDLVMDRNMNKATNKKGAQNKRKEIAQMLTVLKQKQLISKIEEEHGSK